MHVVFDIANINRTVPEVIPWIVATTKAFISGGGQVTVLTLPSNRAEIFQDLEQAMDKDAQLQHCTDRYTVLRIMSGFQSGTLTVSDQTLSFDAFRSAFHLAIGGE